MVADVIETRNVIASLEFKTCLTIKTESSLFQKSVETLANLFNLIFCSISSLLQP